MKRVQPGDVNVLPNSLVEPRVALAIRFTAIGEPWRLRLLKSLLSRLSLSLPVKGSESQEPSHVGQLFSSLRLRFSVGKRGGERGGEEIGKP